MTYVKFTIYLQKSCCVFAFARYPLLDRLYWCGLSCQLGVSTVAAEVAGC